MQIRISKGLDLPIEGAPRPFIEPGKPVGSVALVGADYVGLEPKMLVEVGDRVALGQPLFAHKRDPELVFTAPGAGVVSAINRGARRVLKSVVVTLGEEPAAVDFEPLRDPLGASDLRSRLLASGLWTAFRTRPFSRVPHSRAKPAAIFVTAIDTRPLAADPALIVAEHPKAFGRGLDAIATLTEGSVYLCTRPGWSGPTGTAPSIRPVAFDGPHPAGLPGTHIHHLEPVGVGRSVWHLGYQDVIGVGKLVDEGRLWTERVVALGGNGFQAPGLVRTRLGASITDLVAGATVTDAEAAARLVSGSVLSGRLAAGSEAFLGRYHLQVAAIGQPAPGRRLRWRRLFDGRFSFAGTFTRASGQRPGAPFNTDQNGRATALVPIDAFERLIPLQVLTEPLLRALLIGDTDRAQALGALELDEEDLALCSFVCPGKNDYGAVLRVNLDQIEREG